MIPGVQYGSSPRFFEENPNPDWRGPKGCKTALDHPERYGRDLIVNPSVFFVSEAQGERGYVYDTDQWYEYGARLWWNSPPTLVSVFEQAIAQGKATCLYLGGIHIGYNEPLWRARIETQTFERDLWAGAVPMLLYFDKFRHNPAFSVCLDGSGSPHDIAVLACYAIKGMGFNVKVEGKAPPGSPLAGFPSITTAAAAVDPDNAATMAEGNPANHIIYVSNEDPAVNAEVPRLAALGHPIVWSSTYIEDGAVAPEFAA